MIKPSRSFWKSAVKTFLLCQGIGLAIALILYIYGAIGYFFTVLAISLIYSNINCLGIHVFFYVFKVNWRQTRTWNAAFILKTTAVLFLSISIATEIGTLIVSTWLKRPFIPFYSLWHVYLVLMNLGVSASVVMLVGLYMNLKSKLERRNREYMELENLQVKTRLAALQAKLNPHFLFNTLNVILDLAAHSPEKIEAVVLNLSDIYRQTLGQTESEWSTLGDEMGLVQKYLEIEKLRLEKRLSYRLDWNESLAAVRLPPLLIEPLVENAVIHGIGPIKEGGEILVRIQAKGDKLEMDISDNGAGMTVSHPEKGFGIYSVRERLHLIYRNKARLTITQPPGGGTGVHLEVPYAP